MPGLGPQLPIGDVFCVDDSFHGVTEDMGIVAVVESPLQFFEVTVQMLDAHLVEGADNGTLEQAPHTLNAVGMYVTDNPLLGRMAHRLVCSVFILNSEVRLQLIGVNGLSLILGGSADEIMESVTPDIRDSLD